MRLVSTCSSPARVRRGKSVRFARDTAAAVDGSAVEGPWWSSSSLLASESGRSWRREIVLQGVESVVPGVGKRGEKLLRELHGCGPQPVAHPPALARLGRDQARVGHEGEVFCDRLAADRQPSGKIGGRRGAIRGEGGEDGAAGRVSERDEDLLS